MMNKLDKKWQLKIICLLMAIVLWFFIINEQNPMSEGRLAVHYVERAEDGLRAPVRAAQHDYQRRAVGY